MENEYTEENKFCAAFPQKIFEIERQGLETNPWTYPYRLFTVQYSNTYFGVQQSIDIDSIRYAIDIMLEERMMTKDDWRWFIIALGSAMMKSNNSTGHFAQYLKISSDNYKRVKMNRSKSIKNIFNFESRRLCPAHDNSWRARNRCFNFDSLNLLKNMARRKEKPKILYADPPYSPAQYSRYYHLFDTLVSYSYAPVNSNGRYVSGRYQSPFSNKGTVECAMKRLVHLASKNVPYFLLSYPENGLFNQQVGPIKGLISDYYRSVEIVEASEHSHSSFGASRTSAYVEAEERIYLAHQPK